MFHSVSTCNVLPHRILSLTSPQTLARQKTGRCAQALTSDTAQSSHAKPPEGRNRTHSDTSAPNLKFENSKPQTAPSLGCTLHNPHTPNQIYPAPNPCPPSPPTTPPPPRPSNWTGEVAACCVGTTTWPHADQTSTNARVCLTNPKTTPKLSAPKSHNRNR